MITEDDRRAGGPGARLTPPLWARFADLVVLGVLALWLWALLFGGTRLSVGALHIGLRSPWRIAAAALLLAALRHAAVARPPFAAWLIDAFRRWPSARFILPPAAPPARWWQGAWGAFGLVGVLWAAMTWPQVAGMARFVKDPGDPYMKIWQLSWVAHQLVADPVHLYDANIFFPEVRALAFSDAMIGPSLAAAPLLWAGVPDVLVFNLLHAAGIILSGVAMFVLVRRLTADWRAAMLTAVAYAFLPYRFSHYSHLELQFTWGIPLALWALHRVLETGRGRDGALLGLAVGIQGACSLYYAAYLGVFLAAVGAVLWVASPGRARAARAMACGVLVAGMCAVPVVLPHAASREAVGERGMIDVEVYSATPASYLAPGAENRLYGGTFSRFGEHEKRLFPGVLIVALALAGAWPLRSVPRLAYAAGTVLAFDASLGANGVVYPLLFEYVAPFRGFRVPARFGLLTATGMVVLAGYGAARLGALARSPRARTAVVALLAAGLLAEYRSFPLALFEVPRDPAPVYEWLARQPRTVVAELPVSDEADFHYMFWSRRHWHPLLNGQSGFFPAWYGDFQKASGQFPDAASVAYLRSRGVRHVVVHASRLSQPDHAAFERRLAESAHLVRVVASFPESGDRVFELE